MLLCCLSYVFVLFLHYCEVFLKSVPSHPPNYGHYRKWSIYSVKWSVILFFKVAQEFETTVSIFDEFTDFSLYNLLYGTSLIRNIISGYNKVPFCVGNKFRIFWKMWKFWRFLKMHVFSYLLIGVEIGGNGIFRHEKNTLGWSRNNPCKSTKRSRPHKINHSPTMLL